MKKIANYIPILVFLSVIAFPDPYTYLEVGGFPTVNIFGFTIRLLEIFAFFVIGAGYFLIIPSKRNSAKRNKINILENLAIIRLRYLIYLFLIYSLVLGYINQNIRLAYDLRGLFMFLLIPILYYSIENLSMLLILYRKLILLLIIMLLFNLFFLVFFPSSIFFGYVSSITNIYNLFLFSLLLSHRYFNLSLIKYDSLLLVLSFLQIIISLNKGMFLVLIVILFTHLFLIRKNTNKILLYLVILAFLSFSFLYLFQNSDIIEVFSQGKFTNYEDYISKRILREDVNDISGGRFDLWWLALYSIVSPLGIAFGNGLGGSNDFIYESSIFANQKLFIGEHNLVIWFFLRFGLLGVTLFIIMIISLFRKYFSFKYDSLPNKYNFIFHANLLFILGYLILNFVALYLFVFELIVLFSFNLVSLLIISKAQIE